MKQVAHQPVMLRQVLDLLAVRPGGRYVDVTVGLGGHAEKILERCSPDGSLLGIDADRAALEIASERLARFGRRVRLVHGRFADLPRHLEEAGWDGADGLLADLGVSSLQLDDPRRGFSFSAPGPLDMRMDPESGVPLDRLLASMDARELGRALARYGQVRQAGRIARRIVDAYRRGEIRDTASLARVAREDKLRRVHPSTRVFQALRILVNGEIDQLQALLELLPWPLNGGGRCVFISFHSLEDRLVKRRLQELSKCRCAPLEPRCRCGGPLLRLLTPKAARPDASEVAENPRARSARLRAAERLAA